MMKKELQTHWSYYIFLLVIFLSTMILTSLFVSDYQMQMMIVIGVTIFYILASLIHHKIEHDLHLKIVLEYVMMGALGITVIFLLLRFLI